MAAKALPVALILCAVAGSFAALPKGWKGCSKSSKDYQNCSKKEIQNAIITLANGDKNLGAIPLDPLRITKLNIPSTPGSVNIDLKFSNFDLTGIKGIQVREVKNDWKTMTTVVYLPLLKIKSDYKINGKVLVLPITGEGKSNITLHRVLLKTFSKMNTIDKNGKKYFQMEKFSIELHPELLEIHFTNLFNGDKALGDNMNKFLNENWKEIFGEIQPGIAQALSQAFKQISNAVLARIPANEVDLK